MKTTAEDIVLAHGVDAVDVTNAAEAVSDVKTDQDWDNETTTFSFPDGSQIVVNGAEVVSMLVDVWKPS